jgi:hypothetical protein
MKFADATELYRKSGACTDEMEPGEALRKTINGRRYDLRGTGPPRRSFLAKARAIVIG